MESASTRNRYELIAKNNYVCRKERTQDDDDIPVCQCRFKKGVPACIDETCINCATYTECVPGTCPAKDMCRNQRITKRQCARIEAFEVRMPQQMHARIAELNATLWLFSLLD